MRCVHCDRWGHLKCSNMSLNFFASKDDWICDTCAWDQLPSPECIDLPNDIATANVDLNEPIHNSLESTSNDPTPQDPIEKIESKFKDMRGFKIAHLNCVSLLKYFDEIKQFILRTKIDILTLSETHLSADIDDGELVVPGYCLFRRDRNRYQWWWSCYLCK